MKKILLITGLLIGSFTALSENILDRPEYNHLKIYLKEDQQKTFEEIFWNNEAHIDRINAILSTSDDHKENLKLRDERDNILLENKQIVNNLILNILDHPERYTEFAYELKERLNKDLEKNSQDEIIFVNENSKKIKC